MGRDWLAHGKPGLGIGATLHTFILRLWGVLPLSCIGVNVRKRKTLKSDHQRVRPIRARDAQDKECLRQPASAPIFGRGGLAVAWVFSKHSNILLQICGWGIFGGGGKAAQKLSDPIRPGQLGVLDSVCVLKRTSKMAQPSCVT